MKKSIILVLIPFFIFEFVWSSSAQIKKDGLHLSLYSGTSLQGIERVSSLDLRFLFSEHSTFYSPIKYGPFKTFQPKLVLTVSKYFSKKTIISSTISRSNTHYKFLPKLIWARNESFNDIQRIKPLNYFNINFPYTQFSIGINKTIIEIANNIDSGITEATMSPARKCPKRRTKTNTTINPPSNRLIETV